MPDHTAIQLALRTQLRTLSVCTTGTVTLEATLSGYQRADGGSFLTDGFAVGMELLPAGFANNDRGVIAAVTATVITLRDGIVAEGSGAGRSLTVGLPEFCAWENTHLSPTSGRPYIEEEYIPATSSLLSAPSSGGTAEDTGLYVIRWYGLANTGLASVTDAVSAILELFKAGTSLTVADGTVRVRGDIGPFRGPLRADAPGWVVMTATVPWRLYSTN